MPGPLSCESDLAECTHSTDLIIKCTASLCVALFLNITHYKFVCLMFVLCSDLVLMIGTMTDVTKERKEIQLLSGLYLSTDEGYSPPLQEG